MIGTKLQGSLREFGLVEILQMMEMGSMSGAIHLAQANNRIGIVYFKEGKLAGCSELDAGALTLGDVLQQLGMAAAPQIEAAFQRQLQDAFGKRIGERLIEMRVISESQLREALRTKALWTIRDIGLWKDGTYEFAAIPDSKNILPYGEESLGLDVMRVTMEMVRYADEWEKLQTFLPMGMQTCLQMAPAIPYAMSFDARTLELLGGINRYRSVRKIATGIRRPELDVARDLAQLIQMRLVYVLPSNAPTGEQAVRLPEPAEMLRMEHFELFHLISRMEQHWLRKTTPMEQLPALAEFVNWTMEALAEACKANGTELDPNTLEALMTRNNLRYMGNYRFIVNNNAIDVENFTSLCHEVMRGEIKKANDFYEEGAITLQRILSCIFDSINARIVSLSERLENQEIWEAMFTQFGLPHA
ncbi:MAG TPA: DUF4388 domain-containing protein [Ktedonobacteraceae bacterium]|jgi:hypothetical protein|nr:DUF4388 domain-containing protein [Ktedonobacteraceae bacterium]